MEGPGFTNIYDKIRHERYERKFLGREIELEMVSRKVSAKDGRILEEPKITYRDTGTIKPGKQFELVSVDFTPGSFSDARRYIEDASVIQTESGVSMDPLTHLRSSIEYGYKHMVDNAPRRIRGRILQFPNPKSWYERAQLKVEPLDEKGTTYSLLDRTYHRYWKDARD